MEKTYTYEIIEDGYYILINGERVIHQYEPYIPNPELNYEENALAQIEELKEMDKQESQPTLEERMALAEDAINSILGF